MHPWMPQSHKGHKFTVWTDDNLLTHIVTKPKLDCCEQRSVAKLASYNFDINYVPGQQNIMADALSRVPSVKESVGHRLLAEPYARCVKFICPECLPVVTRNPLQ